MVDAGLDAEAFVSAFAQHGQTLWVVAAAWVGRADAEDLVQEAARVAWQKRNAFAPGTDVRAWLSQIVRNVGANWRRRAQPELREPSSLPQLAAPALPAAAWPFDADRCGLSDELARALAALPEVARACLLLHVVTGHSFAEIAAMLDLPENTAASHARRARLALREALAGVPAEVLRRAAAPGGAMP
jgi:RNA polymerase sigma-70 factor (ECF subfamily)